MNRVLPQLCFWAKANYKGYCFLELSSNKIYISRHILFDELDFPFAGLMSPLFSSMAPESPHYCLAYSTSASFGFCPNVTNATNCNCTTDSYCPETTSHSSNCSMFYYSYDRISWSYFNCRLIQSISSSISIGFDHQYASHGGTITNRFVKTETLCCNYT